VGCDLDRLVVSTTDILPALSEEESREKEPAIIDMAG